MWSLTVLTTIWLSNCSITFWLLLWNSIWLLILYDACNWYSPKKFLGHFPPVTASLEQQQPLSEEEDAPFYYPVTFIFLSFMFYYINTENTNTAFYPSPCSRSYITLPQRSSPILYFLVHPLNSLYCSCYGAPGCCLLLQKLEEQYSNLNSKACWINKTHTA